MCVKGVQVKYMRLSDEVVDKAREFQRRVQASNAVRGQSSAGGARGGRGGSAGRGQRGGGRGRGNVRGGGREQSGTVATR